MDRPISLTILVVCLLACTQLLRVHVEAGGHAAVAGVNLPPPPAHGPPSRRVIDEADLLLEYDAAQRPAFARTAGGGLLRSGAPVNVSAAAHIRVARWTREGALDLRVLLVESWVDERLRFGPAALRDGTVVHSIQLRSAASVWTPDTFTPDALDERAQHAGTTVVRGGDATVTRSRLMHVRTPCPLDERHIAEREWVACEWLFTSYTGSSNVLYSWAGGAGDNTTAPVTWAGHASLVSVETRRRTITLADPLAEHSALAAELRLNATMLRTMLLHSDL